MSGILSEFISSLGNLVRPSFKINNNGGDGSGGGDGDGGAGAGTGGGAAAAAADWGYSSMV